MSVTIESEPPRNSAVLDPMLFVIFETSPETKFSSEYFTEMLLSYWYIFGPSMVKYNILSNSRCSKRHAVIDCLLSVTEGLHIILDVTLPDFIVLRHGKNSPRCLSLQY